jgi:hypothetical protein
VTWTVEKVNLEKEFAKQLRVTLISVSRGTMFLAVLAFDKAPNSSCPDGEEYFRTVLNTGLWQTFIDDQASPMEKREQGKVLPHYLQNK